MISIFFSRILLVLSQLESQGASLIRRWYGLAIVLHRQKTPIANGIYRRSVKNAGRHGIEHSHVDDVAADRKVIRECNETLNLLNPRMFRINGACGRQKDGRAGARRAAQ